MKILYKTLTTISTYNFMDVPPHTPLDAKQIISFEELLMAQVIQQEALTRLLVEKEVFTNKEFLEMVRIVNLGMKRDKE